jgi:transcription-repair coupling factor (superfamily II helicase)
VLEAAIVDFAAGQGDILIATDIIEAGLDIPRANLILVTHSERFGLAQLHQLRGRVGRGSRRGAAYLLTEPGTTLTDATQQRLATMQQLSALGAGVEISAADLNLRGAGDLFGDRQAGHVRAVGTELYQHLLFEAVSMQRGDPPRRPAADLHVELSGRIPPDYVPDENLRIGLLRRMFRLEDLPSLSQFADELQDRFGPPPPDVEALLAVQRLRLLAEIMRLTRIDAGPASCAVTPIDRQKADEIAKALGGTPSKGRVLIPITHRDPVVRAQKLAELLGAG